MLSIIWGWIYNEVFSWGGIGAIVAAAAWAAWFFTPALLVTYKHQLLNIAIATTVFTVAQAYFFSTGYNAGEAECKGRWDAANLKVVQEKAELATNIRKEAEAKVKAAQVELQKQADSFQKQIDNYEKKLATTQGGSCPLDANDLNQLRGIK